MARRGARPPTGPALDRLVDALLGARALADPQQLLDALWLGARMGAVEAGAPTAKPRPAQVSGATAAATVSPPASRAVPAQIGGGATEKVLVGGQQAPAPGLYGLPADGEGGGTRASVVRVAGVPALKDADAIARALRPLGVRRKSSRLAVFDVERTIERFCETRVMLPAFVAGRERLFDAVLLVEESSSAVLWRQLVAELERVLARRVGFRSFRTLRIVVTPAGVDAVGAGARGALAQVALGPRPLLLIASDGTSPAWADGRMADALGALGRRAALAVVQLLPSRLWPNTALGSPELSITSPHPAAINALLTAAGRRAGDDDPSQVVVPLMSLLPRSMGAWAAMAVGQGQARGRAALLARPPDVLSDAGKAEAAAYTATETSRREALARHSPAQRVERLRALAGGRALQAAIHLSSAAPLTLSVVRLVQRVMAPNAPAEELPLLLLGGVLEHRPPLVADAPGLAGDDLVQFDFAPGVREHLQRALLRDDAARILRTVSNWIAERAGSPFDFAALRADPDGALSLPTWARPFAQVARQVGDLFEPSGARPPRMIEEERVAPGVTRRGAIAGFAGVVKVAYSPVARRLLVVDQEGATVLVVGQGGDREALRREAVWREARPILRQPVTMALVLDEEAGTIDLAELEAIFKPPPGSAVQGVTVRDGRMSSPADPKEAIVCLVGGPPEGKAAHLEQTFFTMSWHGRGDSPPVFSVRYIDGAWMISRIKATRMGWQMLHLESAASVEEGAHGLFARIDRELPTLLPDHVLGPGASAAAWTFDGRLAVYHGRTGELVEEGGGATGDLSEFEHAEGPFELAAHPSRDAFAIASAQGDMQVVADRRRTLVPVQLGTPRSDTTELSGRRPALQWSPAGDLLACVNGDDKLRFFALWDDGQLEVKEHLAVQFAGRSWNALAWHAAGPALRLAVAVAAAVGIYDFEPGQNGFQRPTTSRHLLVTADAVSLAWSPEGKLVAVGLVDGTVEIFEAKTSAQSPATRIAAPPGNPAPAFVAFAPAGIDGDDELAVGRGGRIDIYRVRAERPVADALRPALLPEQLASGSITDASLAVPVPSPGEGLPVTSDAPESDRPGADSAGLQESGSRGDRAFDDPLTSVDRSPAAAAQRICIVVDPEEESGMLQRERGVMFPMIFRALESIGFKVQRLSHNAETTFSPDTIRMLMDADAVVLRAGGPLWLGVCGVLRSDGAVVFGGGAAGLPPSHFPAVSYSYYEAELEPSTLSPKLAEAFSDHLSPPRNRRPKNSVYLLLPGLAPPYLAAHPRPVGAALSASDHFSCLVIQGKGAFAPPRTEVRVDLEAAFAMIDESLGVLGIQCTRIFAHDHAILANSRELALLYEADLVVVNVTYAPPEVLLCLGLRWAFRPTGTLVIAQEGTYNEFERLTKIWRYSPHKTGIRYESLISLLHSMTTNAVTDSPIYAAIPTLQPPQIRPGASRPDSD